MQNYSKWVLQVGSIISLLWSTFSIVSAGGVGSKGLPASSKKESHVCAGITCEKISLGFKPSRIAIQDEDYLVSGSDYTSGQRKETLVRLNKDFIKGHSCDIEHSLEGLAALHDKFIAICIHRKRTGFMLDSNLNSIGRIDAGIVPNGIAVNSCERVLISDVLTNRICVFNSEGKLLHSFLAGNTNFHPKSIAINSSNHAVINSEMGTIRIFDERSKFLFGFEAPKGILATDRSDNIVIASREGVLHFYRPDGEWFSSYDLNKQQKFRAKYATSISDVVVNGNGELICVDNNNNRLIKVNI